MDQKIIILIFTIVFRVVFSEDKIVGGIDATPNSIVFQVLLKIVSTSGESFICGGSLLSPRYVLTAAHCMILKPPKVMSRAVAVLGEHDRSNPYDKAVEINVGRVINHPNYNTHDFDFSILELEKPAQLSDKIGYVCLPGKSFVDFSRKDLTISGWGHTSVGGASSNTLKVADVIGISNRECSAKYVGKTITDRMLCATNPGTDSCQGDSGGPLTMFENGKKVLVGVTSWGIGCADSKYPGVYARVSSVLDWIYSNTDVREQAASCQEDLTNGEPNGEVNWNGNEWAQNCDFEGNELSNVLVPDRLCGEECSKTPGCTHYTWTSYNGGTCWMKKGGATKDDAFFADGKVCGVRSKIINWTGNWAFSCDFNERDIGSVQGPGEECSNKCQQTPRCTHFAWSPWNGGTCWLKYGDVSKHDAFPVDDPTVVCGVL